MIHQNHTIETIQPVTHRFKPSIKSKTANSVTLLKKPTSSLVTAPTISSNGRYISFISNASNLLAGDSGHGLDVFVHDRDTGEMRSARVAQDGAVLPGFPVLSDDGRWVSFDFSFNQLFATQAGQWPVLVVDLDVATPIISQVSPLNAAIHAAQDFIVTGSGLSDDISMTLQDCPSAELQPGGSANRRVFSCTPTSAGSKTGVVNIGQTEHGFAIVVSEPAPGITRDYAESFSMHGEPSYSADGRYMAYIKGEIFVRDQQSGEQTRIAIPLN